MNVVRQRHNGITWVDVRNPSEADLAELAKEYTLHPLHIATSQSTGQLPHVEKEKDYLFVLLQVPGIDKREHKIVTDQLVVFLGKKFLVTAHRGKSSEVTKLFDSVHKDEDLREEYFKKSSGYVLYRIIESLLINASGQVQSILEELDSIKGIVFDDRVAATYEIGELRQTITKLKRIIDFLKDAIKELTSAIGELPGDSLARYYHNLGKSVHKLAVGLEEAKETVEIYKDADFTASTLKNNQVLTVLTILFTLTVPATVLGSIYGMNILLPGGIESGPWTLFGDYTTLAIILVLTLIPVALMIWYFKKRQWF